MTLGFYLKTENVILDFVQTRFEILSVTLDFCLYA